MVFAQHMSDEAPRTERWTNASTPKGGDQIQLADSTIITYRKVIRYVSKTGEQCESPRLHKRFGGQRPLPLRSLRDAQSAGCVSRCREIVPVSFGETRLGGQSCTRVLHHRAAGIQT